MQVTEGDCSEPVPYLLTISQVRLSPIVLRLDSPDEFRPVTPRAVLFCRCPVSAIRVGCCSGRHPQFGVTVKANIPPVSLECIMAASGLIESMGRERLKPPKTSDEIYQPSIALG